MFGLSTKGDYGLLFLEYLVKYYPRTISLKEVAKSKQLPLKYLERLAITLKKAGIIKSKEGSGGGYYLSVAPSKIKLIKVLMVLEGDLTIALCTAGLPCSRAQDCQMKTGWFRIKRQIFKILNRYSLADLFNN